MNFTERLFVIFRKLPSLVLGLFLYGVAISLMITADLGMSPWGVFHMGMSNLLPLTFGQAAQLSGLVILVLTCFIKVIPGISSVFNMYFVGLFVDYIMATGIIKTPETIIMQLLMLLLGMFIIGCASFFYLRIELGAGPRDGLMEGLVRLTKRPVGQVRRAIEVTVLTLGFFMGGKVGVGTIIASLFTGTMVQWIFKVGNYSSATAKHMDFIKMVKFLRGTESSVA